jgi:16S rRNA (guanine527-N7)-methyltransferase
MPDLDALLDVLAVNRAHGSVGEQSLLDAVAHADMFVTSLPADALRLADLGSGGGLPGLVIAVRRPDVEVLLIERRSNRADQLRRSVRALDIADRVTVAAEDVRSVALRMPGAFDAVSARSFATPEITATWSAVLLRDGGVLIVSEPPEDSAQRWPAPLLQRVQLRDLGKRGGVRCFERIGVTRP